MAEFLDYGRAVKRKAIGTDRSDRTTLINRVQYSNVSVSRASGHLWSQVVSRLS
jgi:hypothetical protein